MAPKDSKKAKKSKSADFRGQKVTWSCLYLGRRLANNTPIQIFGFEIDKLSSGNKFSWKKYGAEPAFEHIINKHKASWLALVPGSGQHLSAKRIEGLVKKDQIDLSELYGLVRQGDDPLISDLPDAQKDICLVKVTCQLAAMWREMGPDEIGEAANPPEAGPSSQKTRSASVRSLSGTFAPGNRDSELIATSSDAEVSGNEDLEAKVEEEERLQMTLERQYADSQREAKSREDQEALRLDEIRRQEKIKQLADRRVEEGRRQEAALRDEEALRLAAALQEPPDDERRHRRLGKQKAPPQDQYTSPQHM